MTIPGFIVVSLLLGASIAFAARHQIRALQRAVPYNRYLNALLLLEALVVVPAGVYFAAFYPDWSWMYLVDARALPIGTFVMAVASYPVAAALGFLVGYFSARCASDWITAVFMLFVLFSLGMLFAMSGDKIASLGTYEQYHRNVGLKAFADSSLLPSAALAWICIGVSWGHLLVRFAREGRLASAAHT
jgi:hypothetical protein